MKKDSKQRNAAQEADLTGLVQKLYEMTGKDKPLEDNGNSVVHKVKETTFFRASYSKVRGLHNK